ncbi:MAG: hypothetical protein ACM3NF_08260 [Gemmatimonadota bacterium]
MKRTFLVAVAVFVAMFVSGCGGGDNRPPLNVTDIVSDGGTNDGDITNSSGFYSIVTSDQPPYTVVVDYQGPSFETRGFLTFSLASIPVDAAIQRATVFLPIFGVAPTGGNSNVTLFPDMVEFPPLNPTWNQATMQSVFDTAWIWQHPGFNVAQNASLVSFDATDAVIEANRPPPLATLQIRLMSAGGLVEIDDLYDPVTQTGAPVLRVEYF